MMKVKIHQKVIKKINWPKVIKVCWIQSQILLLNNKNKLIKNKNNKQWMSKKIIYNKTKQNNN